MADSVFSAINLIKTAISVPKAGADNHIYIQGSAALDWKKIVDVAFLEGPKPGQEQELIRRGDQAAKIAKGQSLTEVQKRLWHHVYDEEDKNGELVYDNTRMTTVVKNDNLAIGKDQKIEINQNQEIKIKDNRKISAKNIFEQGTLVVNITAGTELILNGPGGSIKIDAGGVTIQGVLVKIN